MHNQSASCQEETKEDRQRKGGQRDKKKKRRVGEAFRSERKKDR